MALESFYGGKQGISPVIKASFKYLTNETDSNNNYLDSAYKAAIDKINNDNNITDKTIAIEAVNKETLSVQFSNPDYQDVWFGELAIIDTESKGNAHNGKIFRRVLKTVSGQENFNAGTQAEYIGQIVGPPGQNPFIALDSLENIKTKIKNNKDLIDGISFIKENNKIEYDKNNYNSLGYVTSGAIKSVSGENNSEIKYTWANVHLSNDDIAYVYLGFQVPYPYFKPGEITSTSYTASPSIGLSQNTITDPQTQEEKINPFSWNIDAEIPRGLPGVRPEVKLGKKEEFTELNSETNKIQYLESGPQFYNETAILKYDEVEDNYSFDIDAEIKDPNDLPNEFWYIKFTCPKRNGNFDILYQYIDEGPNHIESIYGTQKYMYILYSSKEYRFNPSVENPEDFPDEYTDSAGRKWIKDPNPDWEEKNLYWEQLSGFSINRFGIKTKITTDKLSVELSSTAGQVLTALNTEPTSSSNPEFKNYYYGGKDGNSEDIGSQWIQWDQKDRENTETTVGSYYYYYDSVAEKWNLISGLDSETVNVGLYSGSALIDNEIAKGFTKESITIKDTFDWANIYGE